jgi:hypothetical protein
MEVIIITVAILALVGYWIYTMSHPDQKDNDADDRLAGGPGKDPSKHPLARFTKSSAESDKPWPYGEKVAEGKIHVKSADVAPGKSAEDRVEAPAPTVADVTAENKAEAVAKVKKAPAKKQQFDKKPAAEKKPAAAKRTPAKKKST